MSISSFSEEFDQDEWENRKARGLVMGLYLCIFDGESEIDGVEIGAYSDFNALRDFIVRELEAEEPGSRFPTFVLHSDCDGEWSIEECRRLEIELAEIILALKHLPPRDFECDWQSLVARSIGLRPQNSFESFIDVDGEFVLERLQVLVKRAVSLQIPILFQ